MKCEICGKTSVYGKKVAHDRMYINGRSNRKIKPNLQKITLTTDHGTRQTVACTRCIRTMRKKG